MPTNQFNNAYLPYIENLFKAAELGLLLEGEDRDVYIEQISQEMEKRVALIVMSELTRPQFDEYTKMTADGKTQEEILAFLKSAIPNFDDKMEESLKDFAEGFIKNAISLKS